MALISGDIKSTGKSGWLHVFDICAYVRRLERAQAAASRTSQQARFQQSPSSATFSATALRTPPRAGPYLSWRRLFIELRDRNVYIFGTSARKTHSFTSQRRCQQQGATGDMILSSALGAKQCARRELLHCFDLTTCEIVRTSEDEIKRIAIAKQRQVHERMSKQGGATEGDTPVPALSIPGSAQNTSTHLSHAGAVALENRVLLLRPLATSAIKTNEGQLFESGLCAFRVESANEAQQWADAFMSALEEPLAHIDALGLCFSRRDTTLGKRAAVAAAAATVDMGTWSSCDDQQQPLPTVEAWEQDCKAPREPTSSSQAVPISPTKQHTVQEFAQAAFEPSSWVTKEAQRARSVESTEASTADKCIVLGARECGGDRALLRGAAKRRQQHAAIRNAVNLDPKKAHEVLLAHTTRLTIRAGATVVREGEQATEMFIVRSGQLVVFQREKDTARENKINMLSGNERGGELQLPLVFFGERGLLEYGQRTATVRAFSDCELYRLPRDSYFLLREMYPSLFPLREYPDSPTATSRRLRRARTALGRRSSHVNAIATELFVEEMSKHSSGHKHNIGKVRMKAAISAIAGISKLGLDVSRLNTGND